MGNLHAAQLVCFHDSGRSATVRIRCVELLHVPIDFDHGVTGDRDHGDDVFDRIYIDQDVRVGALAARRVVRARVRSDEQHVERLVEVRVRVRHLSDGVTLLFGQTATERFVDFAEVPGTCDACAYQAYKQHAHDADRDFLAARHAALFGRIVHVRARIRRRVRACGHNRRDRTAACFCGIVSIRTAVRIVRSGAGGRLAIRARRVLQGCGMIPAVFSTGRTSHILSFYGLAA